VIKCLSADTCHLHIVIVNQSNYGDTRCRINLQFTDLKINNNSNVIMLGCYCHATPEWVIYVIVSSLEAVSKKVNLYTAHYKLSPYCAAPWSHQQVRLQQSFEFTKFNVITTHGSQRTVPSRGETPTSKPSPSSWNHTAELAVSRKEEKICQNRRSRHWDLQCISSSAAFQFLNTIGIYLYRWSKNNKFIAPYSRNFRGVRLYVCGHPNQSASVW